MTKWTRQEIDVCAGALAEILEEEDYTGEYAESVQEALSQLAFQRNDAPDADEFVVEIGAPRTQLQIR